MSRKILYVLLSIGVLTVVSAAAALSVFTDQETIGANTFSTGDVDLSTAPTTALVTFSPDMVPGDTVTNSVVVSNDGSVQFRYSVASTTSEGVLAAALDLTIKEIDVTTPGTPCDDFDGVLIYAAADLGSVAGINVIGDSTQGADAGDRTLAPAASETLCFRVDLPLATTGPQATTTTATFTFDAEQTQNNP